LGMVENYMKCRTLRRRYLLLKTDAIIENRDILSAMWRIVGPDTRLKIVCSEGSFVILRLDNRSFESLRKRMGVPFTIKCGDICMHSLAASGTIRGAKKNIKSEMHC